MPGLRYAGAELRPAFRPFGDRVPLDHRDLLEPRGQRMGREQPRHPGPHDHRMARLLDRHRLPPSPMAPGDWS
ncbi:hypothetical protein NYE86_21015 [Actinacidiphila bryophytorum]|nr:hypothetical protein [Actinacidiphila bryophytorum]UWE14092.1 hypothetical protein NYE86_21015 [Actinacidiphila bryophytorum]